MKDAGQRDAIAIQHVAFEHLGSFAPVLEETGYAVARLYAGINDLNSTGTPPDLLAASARWGKGLEGGGIFKTWLESERVEASSIAGR